MKANKSTDSRHPADNAKRLFTYAARTEEGLTKMFHKVMNHHDNTAFQALVQNSVDTYYHKLPFRGYAIINGKNGDIMESRKVLNLNVLVEMYFDFFEMY